MTEESEKIAVDCNLCGNDDTDLVYDLYGHSIVRCRHCGLMYVNPRYVEKILHDIYDEDYFCNSEFKNNETRNLYGYDGYLEQKDDITKTFRKRLKVVEKYRQSGVLLDIGCAAGFFLAMAKETGWQVYGADISPFACAYARDQMNLENISCGDLERIAYEDGMFDVVIIFDVIEHLTDPKNALREINRIMKKDGILVVTTPDSGTLMAKFFGRRWEEFRRVREHIYFFSRKSLTRMLEETRFHVLEHERAGRYFTLDTMASRGTMYFKHAFTVLGYLIRILGIGGWKIYLNPFYKVTVYARKNDVPNTETHP